MIDLKQFNGVMDTDSPNEVIGQHSVKYARNIRYRGDGANKRIENIEGTTLIPYNQSSGVNECIGGFYDELKQRIFGFIYNSNGFHSIRILALDTLTITSLLTNGTNADDDCLYFTLDGKITAVKMLYGDDEQGDTIYFNNSLNQPCQINIENTLAGTYGTMKRNFLEVIKYPANRPPYVVYGDDNTVTVNTLHKKLFRFMIRPVYYSREKSVVSIKSEIPLPINANDPDVDKDPTKNSKIYIVYETLEADVQYIEILGQITGLTDANGVVDPNSFSDPFLITTIDKVALGLNNNDIATFEFYNNQPYTEIDPEDAIQLFDLVPLKAEALEMLNGNVPIYGNITEGFNLIDIVGTATASASTIQSTQPPFIFVGSQSGDSAFGADYTGGGINADGVIHLILLGDVESGDVLTVETTNETLTGNSLSDISTAAGIAGFTLNTLVGTTDLYLGKTGESLQIVESTQSLSTVITNTPAYNWNDKIAYCLNYFDKAGRTAGAQTTQGISVQTVNYTETGGTPNITEILLSITSRPPIDAFYFTLGRTASLAKLKFLYWVSDTTFKDTEYAYIGIENLNTFIDDNKSDPTKPSNSAFLAYDFAPGDRIRFIKLLSGSVNTVYTNQDFEVAGQVLSPTINGVPRTGQYIKIVLPTTSSTFDFDSSDFYNYELELYTPALSGAGSINKYYEFGERYTIGDPTLPTRYHQGMTQNQTPNLSQAATFTLNKGEAYYRPRKINAGAEYNYSVPAYNSSAGRSTLGLDLNSQTVNDPNIIAGSSPGLPLGTFNFATETNRAILNVTNTSTYVFRVKGSITVQLSAFGEEFYFYLQRSNDVSIYLSPLTYQDIGPHTYTFDVLVPMVGPARLFIVAWSLYNFDNAKSFSVTDIKITRELPYTIKVIDANYSDLFASAVNSNGRPTIEEPGSVQSNNPQLLRWGKANIKGSSLNEVSRFTALNFDEVDSTKGGIKVLSAENRILNMLQERGCGWYSIYGKILQNNAGQNVLTTTDEIITKNNVQYLAGTFGIGNNVTSFAKTKLGYFFTDSIRGYQIRRSQDGLIPINELYLGKYKIRNILTKYNNDFIRVNGAKSVILGYYDYFEEQYVVICQEGTFNGETIENESFSFSETHKGYCCFYDEVAEWLVCAQDKTFEWKNGRIYIRNNTTDYGKRFGVQTYPSVTLVFNGKEGLRKTFNAIGLQSNEVWESPENGDIYTGEVNDDTGFRQISSLISQDYSRRGETLNAALLRDANSMADTREALLDGDFLCGNFIVCKLTYYGSKFVFLYQPYLDWQNLPRNF